MSKVWFITGSSRGFGRAITEAALEAGHSVVATARRPEQLEDLALAHGDRIRAVALDVTDRVAARQAVREAVTSFGRLDVVVNNAGYADMAALEDVTDEAFQAQMDTNFWGTYHITKAALPVLREQGSGHFVQITSSSGRTSTAGLAAYTAAKWAVTGFSEVLSREVTPLGLRVTLIEPGPLRTDWAGDSMKTQPVSAPYRETAGAFIDWTRASSGKQSGDPAKAAQAVLKVTEIPEPPLHLLLGAGAYDHVKASDRARDASDEKWHDLSVSIAFDD